MGFASLKPKHPKPFLPHVPTPRRHAMLLIASDKQSPTAHCWINALPPPPFVRTTCTGVAPCVGELGREGTPRPALCIVGNIDASNQTNQRVTRERPLHIATAASMLSCTVCYSRQPHQQPHHHANPCLAARGINATHTHTQHALDVAGS